jgi:pimeloyl-ACP methyl ester carboxylesterase
VKPRQFEGAHGVRLAADAYGAPGHPPVVCFPGAGQTRHAWRRTALRLASLGYQVLSVDLRGHGDSAWAADGDYSIEAFATDVRAVIQALPGAPPILLGASIGGIAAAIAVGEAGSGLARALILVDVVPNMDASGLNRIRAFMSAGQAGFGSVAEASAAVLRYLPERKPGGSQRSLQRNLRLGADGRWYWHWDPAFHAGSKHRADQGMFARMAAAARHIHIPVLIVSGSRSEVVNHEGVAQLRQLIPRAQWFQVPGARHMVAGDQNDAFNEAVSGFVRDLSRNGNATSHDFN